MIIEYLRYGLADDGQARDFERDYASAAEILSRSAFCEGYELARCEEQPLQYILQIRWVSLEGHVEGFRKSSAFASFLSLVRPYIPQLLEMRHYRPTGIERAGPVRAD